MKQKIIFSLLLFATLTTTVWSQCLNNTQHPTSIVAIPSNGTVQTIVTDQWAGDYAVLSGAIAGTQLRFTSSSVSDYLTVRSGTVDGPVIGFGQTPLVINNTYNGAVYLHTNSNAACGGELVNRITTVQALTPATHLNFDGVDDYVNCGVSPAYDFTTGTVEAWIKPNSFSDNKAIISLRTDTGNARWSLHVNEVNNTLGIFNGFGFNTIAANIDPNQWYHVAFVMNTTQTEVYLNGVSVGIINLGINTASTGNQLLIGYPELVSWASERFSGSIDDVRIWNVSRTATQISASKNCELQGSEAGLVAYYKFNQGFDAGSNTAITSATATTGSDGTLTNFALTGATSNWLAGSLVTTGSTIPNAPTAFTQSLCGVNTANNLVPAISATIKWYASATATTALVTTDVLTTATYYVAAVNANGCESTRTLVYIYVSATPIVANLTFTNSTCWLNNGSASVAPTGGTPPYTFIWATGQTTNPINNLAPGNYWYEVTDSNGCTTQETYFTISNVLPTAPTAISPQVFVDGATIANLTAIGSNLQWYAAVTGGTVLLDTTTLVNGTTYYVSQTTTCESARTAVVVTINAAPPTITSFTPLTAKPGDVVAITGTGFNTTAANNVVFFGATRATVTATSATSITATVPTGATYAPITLLNTGTSLAAFSLANFTPTYSPAKTSITATDFQPKQDFTTEVNPYSVAIGDLDGDGKPDLAVVNRISSTVSIFRNISTSGSITSGSYATKVDFTTGNTPISVAIGDLDSDGKPDLAVANQGSNSVSIFRNTATSGSITSTSFAAKQDFTTGSNPSSVVIGDLNGDGKPDLAVVNIASNTISVFRNTSTSGSITSGSFATKVDFATGVNPISVAIGDLDGDGKPDLAVANRNSNTVSVFRNTATSGSIITSSFAAKVDFTTGIQPYSVAIGDLDCDGKLDLAVANASSNTVSIFRNTATSGSITAASFAAKVDFTTGTQPSSVAIGDLDGDGKPDLAVANSGSASVSVFRNIATSGSITAGSIAAKVDFTTGNGPFSVAIGDLDGDGKPDLAVANQGSNSVSVIRNADVVSNNANLSNLVLSSGTLSPSFATATTSYSTNVCGLTGFTVTPTTQDTNATIEVRSNGGTYEAVLSAAPSQVLTLTEGSNTIDIKVTAQNGTIVITTVTVTANVTSAPTAVAQSFCGTTTASSLVPAISSTIKWYADDTTTTALIASDALTTGTYYVSETINGCESTRTSVAVSLADTTNPTVIAQNITVFLNASGTISVTPSMINNGSSDNCAIANFQINNTSSVTFTCADIGTNYVELKVVDVSGNVATADAFVTVIDVISPTAIAQNITVTLDASGTITVTPSMINNGSSDNCGIANIQINNATFTCANIGTNFVELQVIDASGNQAYDYAFVTVNSLNATTITNTNDTLTATEAGATNYQWMTCDGGNYVNIAGQNNQSYTAVNTGSYAVDITKNGCTTRSECFNVATLSSTSFEFNSKVNIFPNPSTGIFTISIQEDANVTIHDLLGKVIYTNKARTGNNNIDISKYPSGIYLLNIANENGSITKKLIKE